MRLDKVIDTWKQIELVYQKKGKGRSRKEFLESQLNEDAISKLRSAITFDFEDSEENQDRYEDLFNALLSAQERLKTANEITDLTKFVWEAEQQQVEVFDLRNYDAIRKAEYVDESKLLKKGVFSSVYTLKKGKVKINALNPNSESLVSFYSDKDILYWLYREAKGVTNEERFYDKIYAYLMKQIQAKTLVVPIVFTNEKKNYKLDNRKANILSGAVASLNKTQFQVEADFTEGIMDSTYGKVKVVMFG